ncbi:hypothetical protein Hypma_006535 [Hypsizygus marmoreus]|uniref:Uncharacterized protein n=1 Tax=Hypsizygus marmoreus TaxID=39966 RepID=A0A369JXQ6_HYPMA|nr:hypothetical protein Hypma_006535 [Hypsizygus marmoreus]
MFANRICRIRRLAPLSRRRYSQPTSVYPFSKLRAFPFGLSAEDAVLQMAPFASMACLFKQFVGSIGARYLPGFGFKPITPSQIIPVYFPAWTIDAEMQVEFAYGDTQRTTTGVVHDSYLPGCDFPIISLTSYFSGKLHQEPIPFSQELENQYGAEVSCLPYTISPFSVLKIIRELSYQDATITEDLRFSPSSVKPNLFAAYPVLIPLYLARYEYTLPGVNKARELTIFMEAASPKGRVFADGTVGTYAGKELRDLMPNGPRSFVSFTQLLDDLNVQVLRGLWHPFVRLSGFLTPDNRGIAGALATWLDDALGAQGTAKKLASKSGTISSDSDPRIREFTADERNTTSNWMMMGSELASMKRIAEAMKTANDANRIVTIGAGKTPPKAIFEEALNTLHNKITQLEAKRVEAEPAWWKEWIEISKKSQGASN